MICSSEFGMKYPNIWSRFYKSSEVQKCGAHNVNELQIRKWSPWDFLTFKQILQNTPNKFLMWRVKRHVEATRMMVTLVIDILQIISPFPTEFLFFSWTECFISHVSLVIFHTRMHHPQKSQKKRALEMTDAFVECVWHPRCVGFSITDQVKGDTLDREPCTQTKHE